jgi:hypothetical protein
VVRSVCRLALSDLASYLVPPRSNTSRGRPPPLEYLQEEGYSAFIKIAFIEIVLQRMTLMRGGLAVHSHEHLRFYISILGQFGLQAVTNIGRLVAKIVFWGVTDAIQANRCEADHEPAYRARSGCAYYWRFCVCARTPDQR